MPVRILVGADATAATEAIDRIAAAIEKAGQAGRKFAELDFSHPELAGIADEIRKVQTNLNNLLKAKGSVARDARSIFGSGDLLDLLQARDRVGQAYPSQSDATRFMGTAGRYVFSGTRYEPPPPPMPPAPNPANPGPSEASSGSGSSLWGPIRSGGLAAVGWMAAMAGVRGVKQFASDAYSDASQEAGGTDALLRRTGGLAGDFNDLRTASMELTKGLQLSSAELLRYATAFGAASGSSANRALALAGFGVGEARGFGADPGGLIRGMGQAAFLGVDPKQFASMIAEAASQNGMQGRFDEVLSAMSNWMQTASRVSLTGQSLAANEHAFGNMFMAMQASGSPALMGGNASNVISQINGAITGGGGGGMAGQALTVRAMMRAGIRDPFRIQMQMAGGAFAKVGGRTNFDLIQDELRAEYGPRGGDRMYLAGATYFGMNPLAYKAISDMGAGGADIGGLDSFLRAHGSSLDKVDPTALAEIAQAQRSSRLGLEAQRHNLLLRSDLAPELRGRLKDASTDEAVRDAVVKALAASGISPDENTRLIQAEADNTNAMTAIGRPLITSVTELKDVFTQIIAPIGKIADYADRYLQDHPSQGVVQRYNDTVDGWVDKNIIGPGGKLISHGLRDLGQAMRPNIWSSGWLDNVAAVESGQGSSSSNLYGFIDSTWLDDVKKAAASDPDIASTVAGKSDAQILQMRNTNVSFARRIADWHARNVLRPILDKARVPATDLAMYAAWHYQGEAPAIMRAPDNMMMKDIVSAAAYSANLSELQGVTAGQWRQKMRNKGFSDTSFDGAAVTGASGGQVHTVSGEVNVVISTPDGKKIGAAKAPLTSTPHGAKPLNAPKPAPNYPPPIKEY